MKNPILLIIGSVLGLIIIGIAAIYGVRHLLQLPMYVDREIARDTSVTADWTEIIPELPMKISRRQQSVAVKIDGAYTSIGADAESGLFLPDGTKFFPEVQISDLDGKWYPLKGGSYSLGGSRGDGGDFRYIHLAGFRSLDLPKDKQFRSVRIRSDVPFMCEKVIWRNYDLK
jgi:hypothetical protein